ncbi:MAG: (2Fe-2S)-binding protein [Dehalococcoidia bacterium]
MKKQNIQHECPYCGELFSEEDLKEHVFKRHGKLNVPAPENQIRLTVNNCEYVVQIRPNWTLYYVIHDVIGLTGSKQFCDRGACGSCTMIVDGRPKLSCMMLAIECDGAAVETVEGVAASKHPLIDSYVNNHCMQCGYCTPGFVVSAKSLLDRNSDPTEEEIVEALAGNICRCGTYPQHPIAIKEAAAKLRTAK